MNTIRSIFRYFKYVKARKLWLGSHGDDLETYRTATTSSISQTPENKRRFNRMIKQDRVNLKRTLK